MNIALHLPFFAVQHLGIEVAAVVQVDDLGEVSNRKNLRLGERILHIEEDLELEMLIMLHDRRVPRGGFTVHLLLPSLNLPFRPSRHVQSLIFWCKNPSVLALVGQGRDNV